MKRKYEELGIRILNNIRNELYYYFPYLDGAFSCIHGKAWDNTENIGTNGEEFLFCPEYLLKSYVEKPEVIRRGYLHILLHCLYLHIFRDEKAERRLWNLACDIAVEKIISGEQIQVLETEENEVKTKVLHMLGNKAASAQNICDRLKQGEFPFPFREMEKAFYFDDHTLWDLCTGGNTKEKWKNILSYTVSNNQDHRKRRGMQNGDQEEEAGRIRPGKYDYKKFLKQFSVPREEVELDTESFDYIYYNYGVEHYGNLPLIEPLEYKEVNRLEELVIAIDTSGSCDVETVRRFLGETYSILSDRENFFHKMKVYLIQCDCCIQDVQVIHSEEEWKTCSRNIVIQGRGGTDFRPVFRYVKEQQEKKEIRRLRALIYFTDGDGIYPGSRPDHETAFVFLHKSEKMELVPPWAIRLVAEQEGAGHKI